MHEVLTLHTVCSNQKVSIVIDIDRAVKKGYAKEFTGNKRFIGNGITKMVLFTSVRMFTKLALFTFHSFVSDVC